MEYFIARDGARHGPLSAEQLPGEGLGHDTPVWRQGLPGWVPAGEIPELAGWLAAVPPPLPAAPAAAVPVALAAPAATNPASGSRRAWDPTLLAWLTLLCSPLWGGVMAALNARRLGVPGHWLRPVGIGLGWVAADVALGRLLDSDVVSPLLYLGAIALLWYAEFRRQMPAFAAFQVAAGPRAGWLLPGLCGAPLAAVVVLGYVVAPLLPPTPTEVCKKLLAASTEVQMRQYSTAKLWPALGVLAQLEQDGGATESELLSEEEAPPHLGGQLVAFRLVDTSAAPAVTEGVFHLLSVGGGWKVEEMYVTAYNGERAAEPLVLSSMYSALAEELARKKRAAEATAESAGPTGAAGAKTQGSSMTQHVARSAAIKGFPALKGLGKFVLGVLAAAGLGLAALVKRLGRAAAPAAEAVAPVSEG